MDDETLLHAMRGLLKHLREEEGEPHRTKFQRHMLNYWASAVATEIQRLQDARAAKLADAVNQATTEDECHRRFVAVMEEFERRLQAFEKH